MVTFKGGVIIIEGGVMVINKCAESDIVGVVY